MLGNIDNAGNEENGAIVPVVNQNRIQVVNNTISSLIKKALASHAVAYLTSGTAQILSSSAGSFVYKILVTNTGLVFGRTAYKLSENQSKEKQVAISAIAGVGTVFLMNGLSEQFSGIYPEEFASMVESMQGQIYYGTFVATAITIEVLSESRLGSFMGNTIKKVGRVSVDLLRWLANTRLANYSYDIAALGCSATAAAFTSRFISYSTEEQLENLGSFLGSHAETVFPLLITVTFIPLAYQKHLNDYENKMRQINKALIKAAFAGLAVYCALPKENSISQEIGHDIGRDLSGYLATSGFLLSLLLSSDISREKTLLAAQTVSKVARSRVGKKVTSMVIENVVEGLAYFLIGSKLGDKAGEISREHLDAYVREAIAYIAAIASTSVVGKKAIEMLSNKYPGRATPIKATVITGGIGCAIYVSQKLSPELFVATVIAHSAIHIFGSEEALFRSEEDRGVLESYTVKSTQCLMLSDFIELFPPIFSDQHYEITNYFLSSKIASISIPLINFLIDQAVGSIAFNAQDIAEGIQRILTRKLLLETIGDSVKISNLFPEEWLQPLDDLQKIVGLEGKENIDLSMDLLLVSFGRYIHTIESNRKIQQAQEEFLQDFEEWYPQKGNVDADERFKKKGEAFSQFLQEEITASFSCTHALRGQGEEKLIQSILPEMLEAQNPLNEVLKWNQRLSNPVGALELQPSFLTPVIEQHFLPEDISEIHNSVRKVAEKPAQLIKEEISSLFPENENPLWKKGFRIAREKPTEVIKQELDEFLELNQQFMAGIDSFVEKLSDQEEDLFGYKMANEKQKLLAKELIRIHAKAFLSYTLFGINSFSLTPKKVTKGELNNSKKAFARLLAKYYTSSFLLGNRLTQAILPPTVGFISDS